MFCMKLLICLYQNLLIPLKDKQVNNNYIDISKKMRIYDSNHLERKNNYNNEMNKRTRFH